MDWLPDELVLNIITFLPERDLIPVLSASQRLRKIARDNELWKRTCFDKSYTEATLSRLSQDAIAPESIQYQANSALSVTQDIERGDSVIQQPGNENKISPEAEKLRAIANWDPSFPNEKVNWYTEYIARHGPISVSWTEPFVSSEGAILESRGLGLLTGQGQKVVAPLDDGTVCIWDVGRGQATTEQRGSLIACSSRGLLATSANGGSRLAAKAVGINAGIVECVKVDSFSQKAYIAVENGLSEVDLNTLQLSGHEDYPSPISAISSQDDGLPITIGTMKGLHLHDHRQCRNAGSEESSHAQLDAVATFLESPLHKQNFNRLLFGDGNLPGYASLYQPGLLSIHHLTPSNSSPADGEIYVAGRFPSVLVYDRRTFPRLRTNFHSGASLCCLTSLPYSFASLETELMRKQQLSLRQVEETKACPGDRLIACGEYNGKGALEIYGLSQNRTMTSYPSVQQAGVGQTSTMKNRVSASRSKLLSVVNHGTRILVSDGDGNLRWFERDGSSLVRSWNINAFAPVETSGLFQLSFGPESGDVARKLVPFSPEPSQGRIEEDEILVWTGERIGVLGFTPWPRFGGTDGKGWSAESFEEQMKYKQERVYGETIRRALQRQADEARTLQGLGFGMNN